MTYSSIESRFVRTKIAIAITGLAFSSISLAQAPDSNQQDPNEQDQEAYSGIEIINVTAQKRSENLQEVPIAISAFSEDAIRKIGAGDLNDLGLYTPGLNPTMPPLPKALGQYAELQQMTLVSALIQLSQFILMGFI